MTNHVAGALHSHPDNQPPWLHVPHNVNDLADGIWPQHVTRHSDGYLTLHGHPIPELLATYGSPSYLLDETDFRHRLRTFHDTFNTAFAPLGCPVTVNYASKAFTCDHVISWLHQEGIHVDVASVGELMVALNAGTPASQITVHGNNKSPECFDRVAAGQANTVVIDSLTEIDQWVTACATRATPLNALVRVNVGVEAHTHSYIATAHEDQKFGLALGTGEAQEAIAKVIAAPQLQFAGLHSHIGSQIFVQSGFEVSIDRIVALAADIRAKYDVPVPVMNLGGGFGIRYTTQENPMPIAQIAHGLAAAMDQALTRYDVPAPNIVIEPGRAIAGPSMCTAYTVGTVKPVHLAGGSTRTYVSVDGGMSDNMRPALYGADYSATVANRASDQPPVLSRIVGSHCESGDIVVHDEFLPADVRAGDVIAVPGTGAYCRSMASNYNNMPRPGVVAVSPTSIKVIVRAESLADVLRMNVPIEQRNR